MKEMCSLEKEPKINVEGVRTVDVTTVWLVVELRSDSPSEGMVSMNTLFKGLQKATTFDRYRQHFRATHTCAYADLFTNATCFIQLDGRREALSDAAHGN